MTTVFVKQPLALLGSAKYSLLHNISDLYKVNGMESFWSDLVRCCFSCLQTVSLYSVTSVQPVSDLWPLPPLYTQTVTSVLCDFCPLSPLYSQSVTSVLYHLRPHWPLSSVTSVYSNCDLCTARLCPQYSVTSVLSNCNLYTLQTAVLSDRCTLSDLCTARLCLLYSRTYVYSNCDLCMQVNNICTLWPIYSPPVSSVLSDPRQPDGDLCNLKSNSDQRPNSTGPLESAQYCWLVFEAFPGFPCHGSSSFPCDKCETDHLVLASLEGWTRAQDWEGSKGTNGGCKRVEPGSKGIGLICGGGCSLS